MTVEKLLRNSNVQVDAQLKVGMLKLFDECMYTKLLTCELALQ